MGGRSVKAGSSRFYVGYKKHTMRLWLPTRQGSVTLLPLVTWVAPANVAECHFITPSLNWCERQLGWGPGLIVGDLAYVGSPAKKVARQKRRTAVITKMRGDLKLCAPFVSAVEAHCHQGQKLDWWEYEPETQMQWFRPSVDAEFCGQCWEASRCPRHFGFPASDHETLLGLVPSSSRTGQYLVEKVRPWIEAAQSFEKNQLGLGQFFLNSLRLTWQMSIWADSIVLLRALAALDLAGDEPILKLLMPQQMELGIDTPVQR